MKATHLHEGRPVKRLIVKFLVTSFAIEQVIIWMLANEKKVTKKEIMEHLDYMFYSGGQDSPNNWNNDEDIQIWQHRAKEMAKKLFPTFYKTTQQ